MPSRAGQALRGSRSGVPQAFSEHPSGFSPRGVSIHTAAEQRCGRLILRRTTDTWAPRPAVGMWE